jgi:hypothetical protein
LKRVGLNRRKGERFEVEQAAEESEQHQAAGLRKKQVKLWCGVADAPRGVFVIFFERQKCAPPLSLQLTAYLLLSFRLLQMALDFVQKDAAVM